MFYAGRVDHVVASHKKILPYIIIKQIEALSDNSIGRPPYLVVSDADFPHRPFEETKNGLAGSSIPFADIRKSISAHGQKNHPPFGRRLSGRQNQPVKIGINAEDGLGEWENAV